MNLSNLVELQKKFVVSGKTEDRSFRLDQLLKLKDTIISNQELILQALNKDLGKSKAESYLTEISSTIKEIDHAVKNVKRWMGSSSWLSPFYLFPSRSKILKEPLGSVLVIAPWNYPFHLAIAPAIAAIAAGNSVVIKPSELTPTVENLLVQTFNSVFDENILKVIAGGVDIAQELTHLPFDFIFFTGSPKVGKLVMRAASENLTPVCLELGGKSPCVVDEEADVPVAARRIIWGKFTNAGQTCVAPDFLYVHKSKYDELIECLIKEIKSFYGDNIAQSNDYGRIVSRKHFDRLVGFLKEGRIIFGGESDLKTLYIMPTLLEELNWENSIMKEEIFGPILPIFTYSDNLSLLKTLQSQPKPLAFYLFTQNSSVKKLFMGRLSFGGGCINDTLVHLSDPKLPFGGVGQSGMGAYHGEAGFDLFSHKKSVVDKSVKLDLPVRYPPYNDNKLNTMKKLLSFFN